MAYNKQILDARKLVEVYTNIVNHKNTFRLVYYNSLYDEYSQYKYNMADKWRPFKTLLYLKL